MEPLYINRQKTISQIPNFWPLVFEQAPLDIDQYIDPTDSALLLSSLTSLSVSRFEIESASGGDPRSVAIRFEFSDNEYFSDKVLEKKFWFRKAKDEWSGLVSEPVPIKWMQGKDRTEGLLDMVVKAWEIEKKQSQASNKNSEALRFELSKQQEQLKKKIETTSMGGLSFFAWFGFIGRRVSAEESRKASIEDEKRRKARKAGKNEKDKSIFEEDENKNEEDELEFEIFPEGDDLAIAISEDLWPNAIKYFSESFLYSSPHSSQSLSCPIYQQWSSSSARTRRSFRRRFRIR